MLTITQNEIQEWINKSAQLFIKKLSRNDWRWADSRKNGHQNGIYIPAEIRLSQFFKPLQNVNKAKSHIFETRFLTIWPATGEVKKSRLAHYSNKGPEGHLTGVPKEHFSELTPASWVISGQLKDCSNGVTHWFAIVDSATEESELLESTFELTADFNFGLFEPEKILESVDDELEKLIFELQNHIKTRTLSSFISSASKLPTPDQLADEAQSIFLNQNKLKKFDPYEMENPGDALMKISRDIEYELYKRSELRHRAAEVIRIMTAGGPDIVQSVVRGFAQLNATFLSASQVRKSRAGRSFEKHIARFLNDGNIFYEEQAVISGRRPDFVLPTVSVLKSKKRTFKEAMILSAKTTIRERWKQLALEKFNCALFLATVDDRVSFAALADMKKQGICLVVPESLKKSAEACYQKSSNVITFRQFFDSEICVKRPKLRLV